MAATERDYDVLMVILLRWKHYEIASAPRQDVIQRVAASGITGKVEDSIKRLVDAGYLSETGGAIELTQKGNDAWLRGLD